MSELKVNEELDKWYDVEDKWEDDLIRDLISSPHPPGTHHGKKREEVDHPEHYNSHPNGIECIDVIQGFSFCIGNAIKYLWRADFKGNKIKDLEKARWYIDRELEREKSKGP